MPLGCTVNEAGPDAPARHEVAFHVVDDFVGIDVGVVVRRRNRERVVVEQARHERAHHEARAVERLMHRRRLMHAAGDRLEVVDVERERPQVTVPADDVERVVRVDVAGDLAARLDADLELALSRRA